MFHLSQEVMMRSIISSRPVPILALMNTKGLPWSSPRFFSSCLAKQFLALYRNGSLMASHLLTATTTGRPCSITFFINAKSSMTKDENASMMQTMMWDSWTCSMVLICTFLRYSSLFYSILGVLSPAVSMSSIFRFLYWIWDRMESLVVWGTSETTILSQPMIQLMSVDLPTLGLPMKQIFIIFFMRMFLIYAPLVLENPSSGLTRKSSKLSSSRSSFSSGEGLIFLKSLYHSFILNSFWLLCFPTSSLSLTTSCQNRYSLCFLRAACAYLTQFGIQSLMQLSSSSTPVPSSEEVVKISLKPSLEVSFITSPSSKRLSHLLHTKAILAWLPKVFKYLANSISSEVMGFLVSITNRMRWDSWMAVMVCLNISSLSLLVWDFRMRSVSTPGVSMTEAIPCRILNSLRSLVVPLCLSTMAIRSPTRQLKRLLLPQLGSPTNDTLNCVSSLLRLVFQGFATSLLPYSLVFLLLIMFSICSLECRISCEFLALLEKAKEGRRARREWVRSSESAALVKDCSIVSSIQL